MKLKYHKIKNVPLETCTAESMIAYNIASKYADVYRKGYLKLKEAGAWPGTAEYVDNVFSQLVKMYMNDYPDGKYNIDGISSALRFGLRDFLERPFIAGSYKEIGKAFPSNYL